MKMWLQKNNFILSNLGFDSISDYVHTLLNCKHTILASFSILFGGFCFKTYLWEDPSQIYFLWFLLIADLVTGIIKAIKKKTFQSSKLPRWAGISFTYSFLLFTSFNLAKYSPVFEFVPGSLYALFLAVLFVSIVENLNEAGCLDIKIYNWVKEKFAPFFSGDKKS